MKQLSALFLTLLGIDQLSKIIVSTFFPLNIPHPVLGQLVMIRHIRNPGTVFGLFRSYPVLIFWLKTAGVTLITAGIVYLFINRRRIPFLTGRGARAALVFIASGALGNFIDRLRTGAVIDFIDMGIGSLRWYTYNLADAYLLAGTALFLFYTLKDET